MQIGSTLAAVAFSLACLVYGVTASAQQYPSKPIRFIIGPAPDVLARLVGQKLSDNWGQQVVVDQRPGAGGILAAETVAKAAPDGYTWLLSTGAYTVLVGLYRKLPFDFVSDLAPVSLLATIPFLLVAHPSLPAKSVQELMRLSRARPGEINFASGGTGTTSHLAGEMFKNMAKINIVHVPYKSVPVSLVGVISGGTVATVKIAGQPAAVQGSTADNSPAHIATPPGVTFQKPPANKATIQKGSATVTIVPVEPPTNRPSSRVSRRAIWNDCLSVTERTSSTYSMSRVPGILSIPIPSTM